MAFSSSHTLSWVVSTWEFHLKKKGKVFLLLLNTVIILNQCSGTTPPSFRQHSSKTLLCSIKLAGTQALPQDVEGDKIYLKAT